MMQPSTLWPEVTSPAARRVLVQLFNFPQSKTDRADISDYGADFTARDLDYARWLRARLQTSTLSQQLAAGPCAFPEIDDVVTGVPAALLKLFRPRTLEQYVDYAVINLDWLLEPSARPDVSAYFNWSAIATCTMVIITLTIRLSPLTAISGVLLLALITFVIVNLAVTQSRSQRGCNLTRLRLIHATELYWYLRQAYSDYGCPEIVAPDPANPHVTS